MIVSKYFVSFVVFSFVGWVYESIYETVRNKKWMNRGFLYGPICPIYGVGADLIIIIARSFAGYSSHNFTWWQVFLIGFFGSFVLEYVTSWALEQWFHAIWWDYSDYPLNINGRVCLPAALGFGTAGIFVVFIVGPFTAKVSGMIPPLASEIIGLIFMALFAADMTLTINALTNFSNYVVSFESTFNTHMESFVSGLKDRSGRNAAIETDGDVDFIEPTSEDAEITDDERIALEVERFTEESTRRHFGTNSALYRSAINRVKAFRYPKVESSRLNRMVDAIRNRRDNKNSK